MTGDAARVSVYVAVPPAGAAFARMIGLWWGDLLTALREYAASRTGTL